VDQRKGMVVVARNEKADGGGRQWSMAGEKEVRWVVGWRKVREK
jgi:hypothetical protein